VDPPALEYLVRNIADWTRKADDQRAAGRRNWEKVEPTWGIFAIPESAVGLLPTSVAGLRSIELGCGTAYVSSWLARRGARPFAVDPTPSQLQIARELQHKFGLTFPLVRAAAEHLPFASDSFDFAISEYGAAIRADPFLWVPEAARVLRPGGELVFLATSSLLMLCVPAEDGIAASELLLRAQFGIHRFDWTDPDSTEFHLSHGDWICLLRGNGFEVLDLIELQPDANATTRYPFVTLEWVSFPRSGGQLLLVADHPACAAS
jgi:SAM-dependent methyltransferase